MEVKKCLLILWLSSRGGFWIVLVNRGISKKSIWCISFTCSRFNLWERYLKTNYPHLEIHFHPHGNINQYFEDSYTASLSFQKLAIRVSVILYHLCRKFLTLSPWYFECSFVHMRGICKQILSIVFFRLLSLVLQKFSAKSPALVSRCAVFPKVLIRSFWYHDQIFSSFLFFMDYGRSFDKHIRISSIEKSHLSLIIQPISKKICENSNIFWNIDIF